MSRRGVIIPARNGAGSLGATLDALLSQSFKRDLSVVVAANGCSDNTAGLADSYRFRFRQRRWNFEVIETAPGKAVAINAAEALLPPGPRVYLDHDAVLSGNGLELVFSALQSGSGAEFVTPRFVIAASPSRLVRAYYATWQRIPYVRDSPVTVGMYAVSESGRRRWSTFPLIHSDDKFVRLHFAPAERRVVSDASYTVLPPLSIRQMVAFRRRYNRGNRELIRECGALVARDVPRLKGAASEILTRPSQWPSAAIFFGVHLAASIG